MKDEAYLLLKRKLDTGFKKQKVYLDKSLSLIKLSAELGTNTFYLSKVINESYKMNFKTFVNKYRIEHSKRLIAVCKLEEIPVADIAHQSGFSSVSAFYRVFRKETDTTPQKYRIFAMENKQNNKLIN